MNRHPLVLVLAAAALGLTACGTSAENAFIGERIPDKCDANWAVCDTFAGCRLDNTTYVSGQLPGKRKFIVHTVGPAHIDVSMLVSDAQAQGQSTAITLFEPGCGVQYRNAVSGKTFFAESQAEAGTPFVQSAEVSAGGDHLVLIDSDATASYLLKIDVTERNPTP